MLGLLLEGLCAGGFGRFTAGSAAIESFSMTPSYRSPRLFYGWYVLAASFVILFLNSGGRNVIGVMVKPMAEEFGWSRGPISAAVFVNLAVYALASIITGRLYDRYGPKWVIVCPPSCSRLASPSWPRCTRSGSSSSITGY